MVYYKVSSPVPLIWASGNQLKYCWLTEWLSIAWLVHLFLAPNRTKLAFHLSIIPKACCLSQIAWKCLKALEKTFRYVSQSWIIPRKYFFNSGSQELMVKKSSPSVLTSSKKKVDPISSSRADLSITYQWIFCTFSVRIIRMVQFIWNSSDFKTNDCSMAEWLPLIGCIAE